MDVVQRLSVFVMPLLVAVSCSSSSASPVADVPESLGGQPVESCLTGWGLTGDDLIDIRRSLVASGFVYVAVSIDDEDVLCGIAEVTCSDSGIDLRELAGQFPEVALADDELGRLARAFEAVFCDDFI